MPLDHFVSQVHLRHFASAGNDGLLRSIKKSDLKTFPAKTQDVCRIEDGNTNPFLKEERAIEEFLKEVEPRYNASIQKIRDDKIDAATIKCIAGFVAYVITCSPTGMRLHSGPLKALLKAEASILDNAGIIPKAPQGPLGGKSMTELLETGTVKYDVDPKYPQAMGIAAIMHHVSVFGNSRWEILLNFQDFDPYFTSDYPVAIETFDINTPINRIVPLAPDLAVRIVPDQQLQGQKADLSFSNFNSTRRAQKRQNVVDLNRRLVQCAENLVFYRDDYEWVGRFVEKNRRFWIEPVSETVSTPRGKAIFSTHRIRERPEPAERPVA